MLHLILICVFNCACFSHSVFALPMDETFFSEDQFSECIEDVDSTLSDSILMDKEAFEALMGDVRGAKTPHVEHDDASVNASSLALEAGPSATLAGCVNAITGDYFDGGIDLIVPGPEPLIVQHTYLSGFRCHFSHNPSMQVGLSKHGNSLQAIYRDDNGSAVAYKSHLRHNEPMHGVLQISDDMRDRLTNYTSKEISGKTRWANSSIHFVREGDRKLYHLILGSGTKRIFERKQKEPSSHRSGASLGEFRLKEERRTNGNHLVYSYEDDHLSQVESRNRLGVTLAKMQRKTTFPPGSDGTVTYTWSSGNLKVNYEKDFMNSSFSIRPSHGISTSFQTKMNGFILDKYEEKKRVLRVLFSKSPLSRSKSKIRVTSLFAPVGKTGSLVPIYKFSYGEGCTTVKNAYDWKTKYEFSQRYKYLRSISTYDEDDRLYCKESYYWHKPKNKSFPQNMQQLREAASSIPSEHLLVSKTLEESKYLHFCKHLEYDNYGNVIKYNLWGRLTGKSTPPLIVEEGIPSHNGCEVYSKTMAYSEDGLNLLQFEDDGRKWIRYSYDKNTHLIATKFTGSGAAIFKREFFKYDENGVLVEEIFDDSTSEDESELPNGCERHVRITTPRKEQPIGLPHIIEEYSETAGKRSLIKKVVNTHSSEGKILSQEHYGSDGAFAYTLYREYDRLGNVTKETNAVGETITRSFDLNGNKITESRSGDNHNITFEYDDYNRLTKETENWSDGSIFVTTHTYNRLNQKISTIDSYGEETLFSYDRLGHLKSVTTPPINTISGVVCPTTKTKYNAMGQAIARRDANGHWTKIEYTVRGQPTRIEYPDGSVELKEYSLDGLLNLEIAKDGQITRYDYDPFGRIIHTVILAPDGTFLCETRKSYSTFHMKSETDEIGHVTVHEYDAAGRLISTKKGDKTTRYSYDSLGRICKEEQEEVCKVKRFDFLDRVIKERIKIGDHVQKKLKYDYDRLGNVTHKTVYM